MQIFALGEGAEGEIGGRERVGGGISEELEEEEEEVEITGRFEEIAALADIISKRSEKELEI